MITELLKLVSVQMSKLIDLPKNESVFFLHTFTLFIALINAINFQIKNYLVAEYRNQHSGYEHKRIR